MSHGSDAILAMPIPTHPPQLLWLEKAAVKVSFGLYILDPQIESVLRCPIT